MEIICCAFVFFLLLVVIAVIIFSRTGNKYFRFRKIGINIEPAFKQSLDPKGRFYKIAKNLNTVPSLVAELLKSKSHEWSVLAFESNNFVNYIWVNKGFNSYETAVSMPLDKILAFSKKHNVNAILDFHNHPNGNLNPSQKDLKSARDNKIELKKHGIHFVSFVCGRGRFCKYY